MVQSQFSTGIHDFFRWWGGELRDLLPRQTLLARQDHARRLVVSADGARLKLMLERGGQSEILAEAAEPGEAGLIELAGVARRRRGTPLGLRLGSQNCFARNVELPAQAEADFGRMLDLDMERTTPFRTADVLTAHYVLPGNAPRGKRLVRHLVVKRKTLDPLVDGLRTLGIEPAFADCWSEDRRGGLPVDFLAARQDGSRRGARLAPVLAGLAVALAVSAVVMLFTRHQSALAALNARASAARSEAASVRIAVEASQTASAQIGAMQNLLRQRVPLARIIEELTAILPDSAWVSDLRIDGGTVEFTGFAKSAAALVPLLEASPLFAEAALTSPVMFDTIEDKERFSVRMKLSQGDNAATAPLARDGDAL
ncbi:MULTISPECIES: PilN domain-containing protein [Rhodomicrobium]|uniref:PilN domain-containing protein n=1 Tax=Rhodomicrobium TaxID=1068 RepID=UPI000B4AB7A1|nr:MULTISPECIES: PilN domain-containing protein [Rhodomicrobium]